MTDCFMLQGNGDGGSNRISKAKRMIVRRSLAIGDALSATVVADKLIDRGFDVVFQTHPISHPILRRHPRLYGVADPTAIPDVNLDGAYERNGRRRYLHFHQMFMQSANQQLSHYGVRLGEALNCHPRVVVTAQEKQYARDQLAGHPRPWIFICPRSDSYNVRQVPDWIWEQAASRIPGTKFWLGRHPAPQGIVDLKANDIEFVLVWLSAADLLITVDTGPMHLAAALGVPILAINQSSSPDLHLSDQCDFNTVSPELDCLNCQANVCPKIPAMPPCQEIDPVTIAHAVNKRFLKTVSAVIPIYRPSAATLNRCLLAVLPQVDEVIVTQAADGILPQGVISNSKIRFIQKPQAFDIGFGRNVNFGFRHTGGNQVLVLNDDCYLDPNVVSHLRELMTPGVGIVAHLLRYPSGTIYFGGKPRGPAGFYHLDHNQINPSIQKPLEMENVCGCSFLIDRRAFYEGGCFDEEFSMYAEDDDLCMSVRKRGWKIVYTPLVQGIHEGSKSSKTLPDVAARMHASNVRFGQKWNRYIHHNANVKGLGNFNYP